MRSPILIPIVKLNKKVEMESWPPISFGNLKLEIYENTSQDHTNPLLTILRRENISFCCKNKSRICQLKSDSESTQIIQTIESKEINETVTKITIKFDDSFLSNGINLLSLQFGQMGQEKEEKSELTGLEITLATQKMEGKLGSETEQVRTRGEIHQFILCSLSLQWTIV